MSDISLWIRVKRHGKKKSIEWIDIYLYNDGESKEWLVREKPGSFKKRSKPLELDAEKAYLRDKIGKSPTHMMQLVQEVIYAFLKDGGSISIIDSPIRCISEVVKKMDFSKIAKFMSVVEHFVNNGSLKKLTGRIIEKASTGCL